MRALVAALLLVACAAIARAEERDTHFTAIVFHDVVDAARDLEGDAVTTDALVGFLEWVVASGMHPITLDDVDAAGRGVRPLPPRPILITFDDGYRSLYTRVFPLLLAYRIPAVAALVGEWVDAPMDATVPYGGKAVPRRNFVSWAEAREMADSGLVEFASHAYALHHTVRANPQGSERPAATAPVYDPATGYETHAQYRERVMADLARSRSLMREQLGRAPRALAWPFGRYRAASLEAARAAGFQFAFTLEAEPADAATPFDIARYLPRGNPAIGDLVGALRASGLPPPVQSVVCVDPARLAGDDFEARLGSAIERMVRLGATAIAIDAFVRDAQGIAIAAWFQTSQMPVRADVLSRIAWQMHTRAGVEVYLRIPALPPATLGPARVATLAADLAAAADIHGLLFESAAGFGEDPAAAGDRSWQIRRRRAAVDASSLAPPQQGILAVFRAMEREYPVVKLVLVEPAAASAVPIADLTFVDIAQGSPREAAEHAQASRRFGPWISAGAEPPDAQAVTDGARAFRMRGAMAAGWCPDDPTGDRPAAAAVAPATSASRSPR